VQIQRLLDRGHAYIPSGSGEVYYDISTFAEYGQLSGKSLEDLRAGARVEVNALKRHPADFALWKVDAGHLMQWDPHAESLWQGRAGGRPRLDPGIGKGFPGWHIECSAMSEHYLGTEFDLHTGGEDNMFPHHECEIAQARGAYDAAFARHWMHTRHLLVNGSKMSKSAGTLYTLEDIVSRGYRPLELRYFLIANHYRQPMNFTPDGLVAAKASTQRLQNARNTLAERAQGKTTAESSPRAEVAARIAAFERDFGAGLDDDLNISNALAALFAFVADSHRLEPTPEDAAHLLAALDRADHVTGVLNRDAGKTGMISKRELDEAPPLALDAAGLAALLGAELSAAQLKQLALARHQARRDKNWPTADAIRNHLQKSGVLFEDTPDGVRYKLP
jgi:cysteinyl-tRNA synthetase